MLVSAVLVFGVALASNVSCQIMNRCIAALDYDYIQVFPYKLVTLGQSYCIRTQPLNLFHFYFVTPP